MAHAVQARVMKLFRRGAYQPRETEGRQKLQKELYEFNQCVEHGYPAKPSALAYEPFLSLIAIGTKTGKLYVFGAPGVEFSGQHEGTAAVNHAFFVPEQGRIVTVMSDNSLHLWELNVREGLSQLEHVHSISLAEDQYKPVSVCAMSRDGTRLLAGSEAGDVYILDVSAFTMLDQSIALDSVVNVSDETKLSPGAVECICQHPTDATRYLIGYTRGLIAMWSSEDHKVLKTFNSSQPLESLTWHRDGAQFMSSHDDGSYVIWSTEEDSPKEPNTHPYGPFPCNAIKNIQWKTSSSEPFIMFTGGMPRASYGDRHTVSVLNGSKHQVLDFGSEVIDYCVMSSTDNFKAETEEEVAPEFDEPRWLLVVCEEELVIIDLSEESWPEVRAPLLACVHSAPITSTVTIGQVAAGMLDQIAEAGKTQQPATAWPLTGGKDMRETADNNQLLLTGHEDGSVRFWDVSGVCMRLLYTLQTAQLYGFHPAPSEPTTDEWPPFRKVGVYDPYSDDPRLGIQRIHLCTQSNTLVLAGAAGQVLLLKLTETENQHSIQSMSVNVVDENSSFVWKGHEALSVSGEELTHAPGYQPQLHVQLNPPGAITALTLHSDWQLMAVGTSHGFCLVDYARRVTVHSLCTLKQADVSETPSKRKNIGRSLRQSFRRLRKGGNKSSTPKKNKPPPQVTVQEPSVDDVAAAKSEEPKTEEPTVEVTVETPAAEAGTENAEATTAETTEPTEAPEPEANTATSPEPTDTAATPTADVEQAQEVIEQAEAAPTVEATSEEPASAPAENEAATTTESTNEATADTQATTEQPATGETKEESKASEEKTEEAAVSAEPEVPPVVESQSAVVRCLSFADTFLFSPNLHNPTLWVGTNAGHVYVYTICLPADDKRTEEEVTCKIAKEIQLRHGAPVLSLCVLDRSARAVAQPGDARETDYSGNHNVVVVSEQQVKVFELPKLKPVTKQKLNAHGTRIHHAAWPVFRSRSDQAYSETCVMCATTEGAVHVYRLPTLRAQINADIVNKDDQIAHNTMALSGSGEGFYLTGGSQLARFSLSARQATRAQCVVEVSEELRPQIAAAEVLDDKPQEDDPVEEATKAVAEMDVSAMSEDRPEMSAEITMDDIKVHAQTEEDHPTTETIPEQVEPAEPEAPKAKAEDSEASNEVVNEKGDAKGLSAEEQAAADQKLGKDESETTAQQQTA